MSVRKAVLVARETSDEREWAGGGFGPRALMPIANTPLVFRSLEALRRGGIDGVAIVVQGATGAEVAAAVGDGRAFGVSVEYLDCSAREGIVDVLRRASDFLTGEAFILQEGDALIHDPVSELRDQFASEDLDALALNLPAPKRRGVSAAERGGSAAVAALGGCLLSPRALAAVSQAGLEVPALLASLRRGGGRVAVASVHGSLPCRGGPDAILDANRRELDHLSAEPARTSASVEESELQGRVRVHPTARLHRALVRGPVVIGPRTVVADAYVGPYTALGADVVIEGSEVEHSVVLDGARIEFVGARLEASIVGYRAQIGRDFAFPHALRLLVGDRAVVTLA